MSHNGLRQPKNLIYVNPDRADGFTDFPMIVVVYPKDISRFGKVAE
jgi:hypothetical protein